MTAPLQLESTLTDRYQTTVPDTVRRALRLGKRDKIQYTIRPDGEVVLTRAASGESEDRALAAFLGFLERDITKNPDHLRGLEPSFVKRIRSLVGNAKVDLDSRLSVDDE